MTDSGDKLVGRNGHSVPLVRRTAVLGADALEIVSVPAATGAYSYDPGFAATASCTSRITYVDGERGVLMYRGYAANDLAERSNFAEVAWLLLHGELPGPVELEAFSAELKGLRACAPEVLDLISAMPASAHPMSVMTAALSAMASAYPDCVNPRDPEHRRRFSYRVIANIAAVAAAAYRNSLGEPVIPPRDDPGLRGQSALHDVRRRTEPCSRQGTGHSAGAARRPRTELLHLHRAHGRQFRRQSLFGAGRWMHCAVGTGTRRRQ